MAEIILLNRIRVDIGNVSGSLSELLQYAGMAGFNDNYEPQAKPRLVGTWTINDWYTSTQLAQAQAAFDGLTIVGDPNYLIDFSQLAVQVLDDTQPNYNPAAAIILKAAGYGVTLKTALIVGQNGRWFITKAQASVITNISNWFAYKTTVTDINGIVSSNTAATYNFISFNEFEYFTGVTVLTSGFVGTSITSIKFANPNQIKKIDGKFFPSTIAITNKVYESVEEITQNDYNMPYKDCYIMGETVYRFPNIKKLYAPYLLAGNATDSTYIKNLTFIFGKYLNTFGGYRAIQNGGRNNILIFESETPPTLEVSAWATPNSSNTVYVGKGESLSEDNQIVQTYLANSDWNTYLGSITQPYYNYLHPTA